MGVESGYTGSADPDESSCTARTEFLGAVAGLSLQHKAAQLSGTLLLVPCSHAACGASTTAEKLISDFRHFLKYRVPHKKSCNLFFVYLFLFALITFYFVAISVC